MVPRTLVYTAVALALAGGPVQGQDTSSTGVGTAEPPDGEEKTESEDTQRRVAFEGGMTGTFLVAGDSRVDSEALGSLDLVVLVPLGPGDLTVFAEGSGTVTGGGVAALIPESNGDAGSALDENDRGRLQVSELFYSLPLAELTLDFGLVNPTAYLDASLVANDETTQFLAAPLVNNPSIEFPDYTLGAGLVSEPAEGGFGFNLFLSGSHGLGDNPERSYSELVDLGADGKGVFAAAEGVWLDANGQLRGRVGAWFNSADHERLDGSADDEPNYGLYGVLDGPVAQGAWSARAGWADESVSEAAWFLGAALEHPIGPATAGLGWTYTGVSSDGGPGTGDNMLVEAYARFDAHQQLQLTPVIQYVDNPGFDSSGESVDSSQWVAGLRVNLTF